MTWRIRGWEGTLATALLGLAACGDDTATSEASATGTESGGETASATQATTTAGSGSESDATSEGSGSVSESVGTTATTTATTSASTSATTTMGESTGTTAGTDTTGLTDGTTTRTTGPTCEDLCVDGVCTGDICCPVEFACNEECCAEGQICNFGHCEAPGDACLTASECAEGSYCDYALGELSDKMCSSGSPQTGACLPLPPKCMMGEEPDDLDKLTCLPECAFEGTFDYMATMKYEWKTASVMMPPIIAQLDDDNCDEAVDDRDTPDIIFSSFAGGSYNNNGTLHAISILDGQVVQKWSVNPQTNRIWPGKALAAADLDGVPGSEIIACTETGRVRAFKGDGTDYWYSGSVTYCDSPSIVDFDGDGKPEVLVEGWVLDGQTGAIKATFPAKNPTSWWHEHVIAADMDGDDVPEIVTPSAIFEADGTLLADSKLTGTFPAVADLDGDGAPEVVVIANLGKGTNVHHLRVWRYDEKAPNKAAILRQGIDINGDLNPALCSASSNGYSSGGGPPTIAEFDGDGHPDVGVAGGIGYAVFNGKDLADPNVADADTLVWIKQTQDCSSSFTGSSVYDFDGDGRAEVVYGDELYLRIYRGFDGKVLQQICNTSGTLHEYPLIADVDGDGHADIVAASNNYSGFVCAGNLKTTGVRVFSNPTWTRTRKIWNQHSYHVTNVNDDGTVPAKEAPNWKQPGLNNYRQNYITNLFAAPDLVITEVRADCEGDYTLVARVRNLGEQTVQHGVPVAFYAGDPDQGGVLLGMGATTKDLDPAESEEVLLPLPDAPDTLKDGSDPAFAVADPQATVLECRPNNNKTEGTGVCP
ncbi:MAG: FG-GAP-like repeat-containing protein [Nannocystaceae bacterium]